MSAVDRFLIWKVYIYKEFFLLFSFFVAYFCYIGDTAPSEDSIASGLCLTAFAAGMYGRIACFQSSLLNTMGVN